MRLGGCGWLGAFSHESTRACQEGDSGCSCRPLVALSGLAKCWPHLKVFAGKIVKRIPRCSDFVAEKKVSAWWQIWRITFIVAQLQLVDCNLKHFEAVQKLRLLQAGTNSTFGHFSWRSPVASYSHMIKSYLMWIHWTGFGLLPAQRLEDGIFWDLLSWENLKKFPLILTSDWCTKKTTPKDWLKASDHRNDSESVRFFVINLISCNMGDRMCWGMVTCYGWDLLRGHPSLSACWKQSKRWWPEVQTKSFKDPEGPSSASSSGQRRQTTSRGLKKQKQILKNLMTANVYRCRWHPEACCCNVD